MAQGSRVGKHLWRCGRADAQILFLLTSSFKLQGRVYFKTGPTYLSVFLFFFFYDRVVSAVNWSYCSDGLSLSPGWRSPNTHPCDIRSNFSSTSNSRAVDKESNSGVLFISICTPLLFLLNLPCHVFFHFPWNVLWNSPSGWTLQVIRRMQQGFTSFLLPYMAGKQRFF